MIFIENISTIPNTWILLFKLSNSNKWKYIYCKEMLSFNYAKKLIPNTKEFQKIKKYDTKVSWNNDQMDICIYRLIEDGKDLIIK